MSIADGWRLNKPIFVLLVREESLTTLAAVKRVRQRRVLVHGGAL
jgi:hypothetical protein